MRCRSCRGGGDVEVGTPFPHPSPARRNPMAFIQRDREGGERRQAKKETRVEKKTVALSLLGASTPSMSPDNGVFVYRNLVFKKKPKNKI